MIIMKTALEYFCVVGNTLSSAYHEIRICFDVQKVLTVPEEPEEGGYAILEFGNTRIA